MTTGKHFFQEEEFDVGDIVYIRDPQNVPPTFRWNGTYAREKDIVLTMSFKVISIHRVPPEDEGSVGARQSIGTLAVNSDPRFSYTSARYTESIPHLSSAWWWTKTKPEGFIG